MFRPDGLAVTGVSGAPALDKSGDQKEAAAALVGCPGVAQVGEVLLPSETSQMSVRSRMSRSRMGPEA